MVRDGIDIGQGMKAGIRGAVRRPVLERGCSLQLTFTTTVLTTSATRTACPHLDTRRGGRWCRELLAAAAGRGAAQAGPARAGPAGRRARLVGGVVGQRTRGWVVKCHSGGPNPRSTNHQLAIRN